MRQFGGANVGFSFSKTEVLNMLKQLRTEIIKETRKIYRTEFDILMDNYRLNFGQEDRENMLEYLETLNGYKNIDKLPSLI